MFLVTEALAQEAQTPDAGATSPFGSNGFSSFIPLVLIFLVFYFILIRPQQKKMKEHQRMVEALKRGDKVVAASGIFGTITKVETDTGVVQLEVAPEVKIRVRQDSVTEVLSRTEVAPAKENNAA